MPCLPMSQLMPRGRRRLGWTGTSLSGLDLMQPQPGLRRVVVWRFRAFHQAGWDSFPGSLVPLPGLGARATPQLATGEESSFLDLRNAPRAALPSVELEREIVTR